MEYLDLGQDGVAEWDMEQHVSKIFVFYFCIRLINIDEQKCTCILFYFLENQMNCKHEYRSKVTG